MTDAVPIQPLPLWKIARYGIGQGALGSLIAGGLSAVLIVSIFPYHRASDSLEAVGWAFVGGAAVIAFALVPAMIGGGTNTLVLRLLYSRIATKASASALIGLLSGLVWGALPAVMYAGPSFGWPPRWSVDESSLFALGLLEAIGGVVGGWHGWRMFRYLRAPESAKNVAIATRRPRLAVCIVLAVLALLLAELAALSWAGVKREQSVAIARDAHKRIRIGMTRSEVEQQIDGYWQKRYQCYGDVYLFRSSDPNLASISIHRYGQSNGVEILEDIGGIDISMFSQFESCPSTER